MKEIKNKSRIKLKEEIRKKDLNIRDKESKEQIKKKQEISYKNIKEEEKEVAYEAWRRGRVIVTRVLLAKNYFDQGKILVWCSIFFKN